MSVSIGAMSIDIRGITSDPIARRELAQLMLDDPSGKQLGALTEKIIAAVDRSFKSGAHPMRRPTHAEALRRAKILADAFGRARDEQQWPLLRFYDYMDQALDAVLNGREWTPPEGRIWKPVEFVNEKHGGVLI